MCDKKRKSSISKLLWLISALVLLIIVVAIVIITFSSVQKRNNEKNAKTLQFDSIRTVGPHRLEFFYGLDYMKSHNYEHDYQTEEKLIAEDEGYVSLADMGCQPNAYLYVHEYLGCPSLSPFPGYSLEEDNDSLDYDAEHSTFYDIGYFTDSYDNKPIQVYFLNSAKQYGYQSYARSKLFWEEPEFEIWVYDSVNIIKPVIFIKGILPVWDCSEGKENPNKLELQYQILYRLRHTVMKSDELTVQCFELSDRMLLVFETSKQTVIDFPEGSNVCMVYDRDGNPLNSGILMLPVDTKDVTIILNGETKEFALPDEPAQSDTSD